MVHGFGDVDACFVIADKASPGAVFLESGSCKCRRSSKGALHLVCACRRRSILISLPGERPDPVERAGTEPLMEFEAGCNHYRDVNCVTANLFAAVFADARSGITVWNASNASALVTVEFPGTASGRTLRNICALPSPDPSTGRLCFWAGLSNRASYRSELKFRLCIVAHIS